MKKTNKRVLAVLLAVMMLLTSLPAMAATTTEKWIIAGKKVYQWGLYENEKKLIEGSLREREVEKGYVYGSADGYAKKVSSSNSKVIKAYTNPTAESLIRYKILKAGKTTVTVTGLDYGEWDPETQTEINQKPFKQTIKHEVYKYTNPLKTLKIGKKNLTKKCNAKPFNKFTNASGKLSVSAKKGWKIKQIRFVTSPISGVSGKYMKGLKVIKNGSKVNLKKGVVEVVVYNTKSKYYMSVVIGKLPKDFNIIYG